MTRISDLLFTTSKELNQKEIFHYTSVESFYKIITNKSLRLSSSKYLNDYKELKILRELIDPKKLDNKGISYNNERVNEINNLVNNSNQEAFIISFSKHRDLLSQWRRYADNSKGVSIGIHVDQLRNKLIELMPKSSNGEDLSRIHFKSVIYNIKQQCEV
jgi:hypothetical protein